jgi:hypothetical protein
VVTDELADFIPAEATAANLRAIAQSEVAAFREINGQPSLDDIRHLVTRVKVQIQPGPGDWDTAIECEVHLATSQSNAG